MLFTGDCMLYVRIMPRKARINAPGALHFDIYCKPLQLVNHSIM